MNRALTSLQRVGYGLAGTALIFQICAIVTLWWDFDSRTSCDRLQSWREWLSCLHSSSHQHVLKVEYALAIWAIAGLVLILAKRLPAYVSVLGPLVITIVFAAGQGLLWKTNVVPRMVWGEPTGDQLMQFAFAVGADTIFSLFPLVGLWLIGLNARRMEKASPAW
jgi:hypothetical protein